MRRLSPMSLAIILGSVLVILFFHQLAFTDLILARGDTYNYFYPYWDARNEAFSAGQLPLWSPDIFMGVPLLANPQIGTFYPPNWLTIPLSAPDAIRYSILGHLILAFVGAFVLFRRMISSALVPALIASIVFVFGGYLGAHVEQINQLQGLALLPWLLYCYYCLLVDTNSLRWGIILAMGWALQIFSGHTQTVFMTGFALGIVGLWHGLIAKTFISTIAKNLAALIVVALTTIVLAIPQLLPTLELTGMSNRGGGFTAEEATAFSLAPTYLGHGLLPNYSATLFSEYIAYVGVIALGFAIYAMLTTKSDAHHRWLWIGLCIIGVGFALGEFNPLYLMLANLPGFNLFRVPARWLVLYSLGIAMLAGYGVALITEWGMKLRKLAIVFVPIVALMLMARLLPVRQIDIAGSAIATVPTMLIWSVSLVILSGVFFVRKSQYLPTLALIAIAVELLLASQVMWYNRLVPPDVYDGQRFTISQMLALTANDDVPSRMVSVSERQFDVGDIATLQTRFESLGLDTYAQDTAFTAIKNQELLAPNQPMAWGIPSIDGYGGGVLPTIYYTQYTSLLLPPQQERIADGRLVEVLASSQCRGACLPNIDYLRLLDTAYIITDRTFDVPYQEVFYDTSLSEYWISAPARPDFDFDEVRLLLVNPTADAEPFEFLGSSYYVVALAWDDFVDFFPVADNTVLAASIVNTQTNTFQQLTPPAFERILSSDVKIYQLSATSRAGFLPEFAFTPDDWQGHEDALTILRDRPNTLVLHDAPERNPASGTATITEYTATSISIAVSASDDTYLYLADAYYPGWQATVNNTDAPVYRANVMFRAIPVPQGDSTVVVRFVPQLWYGALILGLVAWGLATFAGGFAYMRLRR